MFILLQLLSAISMGSIFGTILMISSKEQWGIRKRYFNSSPESKFGLGFLIGFIAGAILTFLDWWLLVVGAAGWLISSVIMHKERIKQEWKRLLFLGIFLMIFDFVFENLGAIANLWYSYQSVFFVMAVPIEVMVACLMSGFCFGVYMPKRWDSLAVFLICLSAATGGMIGEYSLSLNGKMIYGSFWNFMFTFVAYFLIWLLVSVVYYRIIPKFISLKLRH